MIGEACRVGDTGYAVVDDRREPEPQGICLHDAPVGAPHLRCACLLISAVVVVLGACSPKSETGSHATRHPPTDRTTTVVGTGPLAATKMICETEAKRDIAQSGVGFDTIEPLVGAWDKASRIYSCQYVYADGANMTLSVKETSSPAATTAYFESLADRLGEARRLFGTGNGAFSTPGGDVVVRKDSKVLLVDVSKLPPRFGKPADARESIATNVRGDHPGMLGRERRSRVID